MFNLIVIGDAVVDTHVQIDNASVECDLDGHRCKLCLDYASKIPITDSFQTIGGDGANIAAGATKLGLKTAILTSLGADSNGQLILEELRKLGVDASLAATDPAVKTRYSVVLNFKGERTILAYHQKRKYDWPKAVPATDWFYYTGVSEGFEDLQEKLLKFLVKHPTVRLAFTPGSYQLKKSLDSVREATAKADVIIINLEEAEKILNTTLAKERSMTALIHKLLALGVKEVVITDGVKGAWAGNMEEIWQMKPYPVEVISKTGAGDAFASAYVSARFYGHDIKHALTWGTANSCGVIGHVGAQSGLLDKERVEAMIKKYKDVKPKSA